MKKQQIFLQATIILSTFFFFSKSINGIESNDFELSTAHKILKNSCSTTLYPELCFNTLADTPELTRKIKTHKNVIELSLNRTITTVKANLISIHNLLSTKKNLTEREATACSDCLETLDDTLDELAAAINDLEHYPKKKSLKKYDDDLKTLLSTAMTNQETCLDGFSYNENDKNVRHTFEKGEVHLRRLCSNALAMICNLTGTDIKAEEERLAFAANNGGGRRKLKQQVGEEESEGGWPKWLRRGDRRLLQATTVTPNVVVAADGSGNFKTVSAAVAAAPAKSSKRYVIRIKAGVYRENVDVPKTKTNIMFLGDGRKTTIITGSRNVVDGSTTFHSATVAVVGANFLARDITFQNTAGPSKHQAVALRVGSDLSAFYRCDIVAYQDTLYLHSNRQFFSDCFISGTVDFIFGNAAAVIQNSAIQPRKPDPGQKNMVTAQSRIDPNQNTGFVLQKCTIAATSDLIPVQKSFPSYLGRPWKEYSRVVVMQSSITNVIDPAGWFEWNGAFALNTLFYGEYQNTGAGAVTSGRVKWKGVKVLSAAEAQTFTTNSFIDGNSWLASTGIPFSLSL